MKKLSAIKLHKPRTTAEMIFDSLDVSETTRQDYSARVGLFLSYVEENGFNRQSCLSFKRYLAGRNDFAVSTKNKYLATARVFLKELTRRGLLPLDVAYSVKQFKQSKRHKKEGLSAKEVELIGVKLQFLPSTPRYARLQALFALLAFQGFRQIEIVRLDVEDLDLSKKIVHIHGKGEDDTELVHLAPQTIKALKDHLRINKITEGAVFRSMSNRKSERMSTDTIKREIGSLLYDLGIKKSVHGFRHFYVTELLKSMDVRDVRKFSRHKSMEMLLVYDDETSIQEKAQQVFKVMEKFSFSR